MVNLMPVITNRHALDKEANLFVKNVDSSINQEEFETFL
jgi:hypothetical protein